MKGYRTATSLDLAYILRMLTDGDSQGVLVRSLLRSDLAPYPLLEISRPPYRLSQAGIEGFSLEGERCMFRITDTPLHYVELQRGGQNWIAPEMSSVILLVPE